MSVLFDTSILVAASIQRHPKHDLARVWLDRAHSREFEWCVGAHTLAELYSVLTAYPIRPRISPAEARQLIKANIEKSAAIIALDAADYQAVLQRMAELDLAGGTIYDALIAKAAQKAGVERLITLNPEHFRRVWPEGAAMVESV